MSITNAAKTGLIGLATAAAALTMSTTAPSAQAAALPARAAAVAPVAAQSVHAATYWQKWSSWAKVPSSWGAKCRTYVAARAISGSKLIISGSVDCTRKIAISGYLSGNRFRVKSKFCWSGGYNCYISKTVKNPKGRQEWRIAMVANHFASGDVKPVALRFYA